VLLLSFFGRRRPDVDLSAFFERDEGQPALKVTYSKNKTNKDKISDILPMQALRGDDVERLAALVDAELIQERPQEIGRRVLFAAKPVRGFFRYDTKLQILPVPEGAPRSDRFFTTQHPFLFEFCFRSSDVIYLKIDRRTSAELHWTRILNGLSSIPISRPAHVSGSVWVWEGPGTTSHLANIGYSCVLPTSNEFSQTDNIPTIPRVPRGAYYAREAMGPNDPFDLSDDFEASLARYDALDEEQRERFARASYWFQHAQEVWTMSNSAAIIAFVSAIEALGPKQDSLPRCEKCNQITGATKTFHNLVETLVPGADVQKAEFYQARSKLAHGGGLLANEINGPWGGGADQRGSREDYQLRHLARVVRIALYNGLLREERAKAGA
jgi:hypothetical protein